jgi:citrate lyase subunit beta/citryl-CoA lyase
MRSLLFVCDIVWATCVITTFDAAPGAGVAALDGRMLDRPHYRRSHRALAGAATTE